MKKIMLVELLAIAILMTPFFGLIFFLARRGEEECLEGLDEGLKEWNSVKEGWNEL